jgi:hypothetical protein
VESFGRNGAEFVSNSLNGNSTTGVILDQCTREWPISSSSSLTIMSTKSHDLVGGVLGASLGEQLKMTLGIPIGDELRLLLGE